MANTAGAIAGLVTLGATVVGVNGSYDLKGFFDAVAAGTLATPPILLAVPELGVQTGWHTLAFMGNAPQDEFVLQHYLLVSEVGNKEDFTYQLPAIVTLLDAYKAALKAQPYLTPASAPAIHTAPHVSYQYMRSKWGETQYHSLLFQLTVMQYL